MQSIIFVIDRSSFFPVVREITPIKKTYNGLFRMVIKSMTDYGVNYN